MQYFGEKFLRQQTPAQWCGEGQTSPQQNKRCRFWRHHWDTRFRGESFAERRTQATSDKCCWTAFRCFHTSNPRGCCCLVVRPSAVGEFCQEARCRRVAVFVNVVARRPFPVRTNRARSNHIADFGRSGVAHACRTKVAAFLASWSLFLPTIQAGHPAVATELVRQLEEFPTSPTLQKVATSRRELIGIMGSSHPRGGRRQKTPEPQKKNRRSSSLVVCGEDGNMKRRPEGVALSTCPTCRLTKFDAQVFRVLLSFHLSLRAAAGVAFLRCLWPSPRS